MVSTIHQPSSDSFLNFDRLILMADGYIVYQGFARDSAQYFDLISGGKGKHLNPCDYFMKELAINYPKGQDDEMKIAKWKKKYEDTQA